MVLGNLSQDDNWAASQLNNSNLWGGTQQAVQNINDNQSKLNNNQDQYLFNELAIQSNDQSDKSNGRVEKKLREENMILRQEIIKLKRALYMNANDQISVSETGGGIGQMQSNYNTLSKIDPCEEMEPNLNNIDSELISLPQMINDYSPKSKPQKPTSSMIYSNQCFTVKPEQSCQEYPFNMVPNTHPGFKDETPRVNKESPSEMQSNLKSVETKQHRADKIQMIEKSIEGLKLRDKMFNQLNKSSSRVLQDDSPKMRKNIEPSETTNQVLDSQQLYTQRLSTSKSIITEDEGEDGGINQYTTIHINNQFMDDNEEGFEDKKRKSSVFEQKRYYELELQTLKKELEQMMFEEEKLKVQMVHKGKPACLGQGQIQIYSTLQEKKDNISQLQAQAQKEFTFKQNEKVLHKLQVNENSFGGGADESVLEIRKLYENTKREKENNQQMSKAVSQQQLLEDDSKGKDNSNRGKHKRIKSIEQYVSSHKKQFNFKLWQPPSFCPSHYNSLKQSPKSKVSMNQHQKKPSKDQQYIDPQHPLPHHHTHLSQLEVEDENTLNVGDIIEESQDYKCSRIEDPQMRVYDSCIQGEGQKQLIVSDADILEHIFQNDNNQKHKFKCLDQYANILECGQTFTTSEDPHTNNSEDQRQKVIRVSQDEFSLVQHYAVDDQDNDKQKDNEQHQNSFNENSFCLQNEQSDSVAIVRANHEVRNEQMQNDELPNNFKQSLNGLLIQMQREFNSNNNTEMLNIKFSSPYDHKKQRSEHLMEPKDQSPSFGGVAKLLYHNNQNPNKSHMRHLSSGVKILSEYDSIENSNVKEQQESIHKQPKEQQQIEYLVGHGKHRKKSSMGRLQYTDNYNGKKNSIFSFADCYQTTNNTQHNSKSRQNSHHKSNSGCSYQQSHHPQSQHYAASTYVMFENYQRKQRLQKMMKGVFTNKRRKESQDLSNNNQPNINYQQNVYNTIEHARNPSSHNQSVDKNGAKLHNKIKQYNGTGGLMQSKSHNCLEGLPTNRGDQVNQTQNHHHKCKYGDLTKDEYFSNKHNQSTYTTAHKPISYQASQANIQKAFETEKQGKNQIVLQQTYNSNTPKFYGAQQNNNKSCFLDPQRIKSAMKKRDEMTKKKEEYQRSKLNVKLAKISDLQRKKDDYRKDFEERKNSKSPCAQTSTYNIQNYQQMTARNFQNPPSNNTSNTRTPKGNGNFGQNGLTPFQDTKQSMFNGSKQNEQSHQSSQQRTPNSSTPISKRNYESNNDNNLTLKGRLFMNDSLFENRKQSDRYISSSALGTASQLSYAYPPLQQNSFSKKDSIKSNSFIGGPCNDIKNDFYSTNGGVARESKKDANSFIAGSSTTHRDKYQSKLKQPTHIGQNNASVKTKQKVHKEHAYKQVQVLLTQRQNPTSGKSKRLDEIQWDKRILEPIQESQNFSNN